MKVSIMCSAFLMFMLFSTHGKGQAGFEWPMAGHCIASLDEGKVGLQLTEWPDSEFDILAIGGMVGDSVVSSCDHYDAENDAWNPIASLPNPRIEFTAHTFAGKVYVIGGWDGDSTVYNDVLEFDPAVGEWDVVTSLLGPRKGHASVHEGPMESGSILVCGGNNGTAGLATCELVNLLNYEVLPADTMIEPRERFQLFRMEKYSSEQFTMNIGESWKEGYFQGFPEPITNSDFSFPVPGNYQGIMAIGGFNSEMSSPTASCEQFVDTIWIPIQDLPIPIAEYSYGMNVNPYAFEANVWEGAFFDEINPYATTSPIIYGGVTTYSEIGEDVLSSNLMGYNFDTEDWQIITFPQLYTQKNQVLFQSPRIFNSEWLGGFLDNLVYLIGGEEPNNTPNVSNFAFGLELQFEGTLDYFDLISCFNSQEPESCNPDLSLVKPGFIQRGKRGYIVGASTESTAIWFDLSPVYTIPNDVMEPMKNKLTVFPNPSKDIVRLQGINQHLNWTLYNSGGLKVLSGQGQEVKVNNFTPGAYYLRTEDGRKAVFVVE